ncbi:ECF transporter S component [Feifania hominis]|uniref:ECF transporter S component n=1 Tax=Feifania hominis TaxID=2763660 RepID=A0A926DDJ6_9FIRM|nr:ECF transporter S component [Feifania hominis]MBC8535349.1 ECF transporter S component [Feifania hominis]
MKQQQRIQNLTKLALLIALLAILTFTPLGFIMVPPVSITIMHIPVIIGAVLMGPVYGGVLGFSFGLFSMIKASYAAASPVDMLFSPFFAASPLDALKSIVMCFLPRILLGVFAALLYRTFRRCIHNTPVSVGVAAALASVLHTVMVLGCLWLFFDGIAFKAIFATFLTVNGLIELAAAPLIAVPVCSALMRRKQSYD